jgi:hypothetical protein
MMELTEDCRIVTESEAAKLCHGRLVYIASPYTHDDYNVVSARYRRVRDFSARMIQSGVVAFSPIAYSHQFAAACDMGGDFAAWEQFDFGMLAPMEVFLVYMDDGWESSIGIAAESVRAEATGIPALYVVPDEEVYDD